MTGNWIHNFDRWALKEKNRMQREQKNPEVKRLQGSDKTHLYLGFMKEHLFHASYKESKDKPKIEAMFDQLPGKDFELKLPNPDYPKYPIITSEKRVAFKPLFDAIYAEARADGCIWIPFEETSPKPKLSYAE